MENLPNEKQASIEFRQATSMENSVTEKVSTVPVHRKRIRALQLLKQACDVPYLGSGVRLQVGVL